MTQTTHPENSGYIGEFHYRYSIGEFDQTDKLKAYAENGIPEYWILDVEQMQLEVYREPKGNAYLFKHVLQKGQSASLLEFPDIALEWWGFDAQ